MPTIKRSIYWVVLVGFIHSVSVKFNTSVLPNLNVVLLQLHHPDLGPTQISAVASEWSVRQNAIENILSLILVPFYGGFSDFVGRKLAMVVHLSMVICSFVAFALISHFHTPIVTTFIPYVFRGLSAAVLPSLILAYISDISDDDPDVKARKFSYYFVGNFLGGIGPFFGGYLFDTVSEEVPFYISLFFTVLTLLMILRTPESLRPEDRQEKLKFKDVNIISALALFGKSWPAFFLSFVFVIGTLLIYGMNNIFIYYMVVTFDYEATQTGLFIAIRSFCQAVLSFVYQLVEWTISRITTNSWILMNIVRIGLFFTAFSMVLYALVSNVMFFAVCILYGFCAFLEPAIRAIFASSYSSREQGKILTSLGAMKRVQMLTARPLFELMYSKTVGRFPAATFYAVGGVTFITLMLTFFIQKSAFNISQKPNELSGSCCVDFSSLKFFGWWKKNSLVDKTTIDWDDFNDAVGGPECATTSMSNTDFVSDINRQHTMVPSYVGMRK